MHYVPISDYPIKEKPLKTLFALVFAVAVLFFCVSESAAQSAEELNDAGGKYYQLGQYDKAIEHYRQALAIIQKLGQEDKVAAILNNIGSVYEAWGQYDKAIEHFRQALAIAQKLGRETDVATYLNNIGGVYHDRGQNDKAIEHCAKAGKRLPTEWEWEKSAKGGTATAWHWGDSPDDAYGWWAGNSGNKTHPVGEKKPNSYDLYDMAGNVWEWTSSDYDNSGKTKVLRGGSWGFIASNARPASRYSNAPGYRFDYVGFRCAK